MRKGILLCCLILIVVGGCSESPRSTDMASEGIKEAKEKQIMSIAEKCDQGISVYYNETITCEYWQREREKIITEKKEEEQRRKENSIFNKPEILLMIVFSVLAVIGTCVYAFYRERKIKTDEVYRERVVKSTLEKMRPLEAIMETDKNFSEADLRENLELLLLELHEGLRSGDFAKVEPYISGRIMTEYMGRYKTLEKEGTCYTFENLLLKSLYVTRHRRYNGFELLDVEVFFTIHQKYVFEGGKENSIQIRKKYTCCLERPADTVTPRVKVGFASCCKQCGAPIKDHQANRCDYCGCITANMAFTWRLTYMAEVKEVDNF